VGAIVSAVAVVWGIVHFFLEQKEPPKSAPKPEAAASSSRSADNSVRDIISRGDNNVIIGGVSGGQVNVNKGDKPSGSSNTASSSTSSHP
jgi:hypothetical protein